MLYTGRTLPGITERAVMRDLVIAGFAKFEEDEFGEVLVITEEGRQVVEDAYPLASPDVPNTPAQATAAPLTDRSINTRLTELFVQTSLVTLLTALSVSLCIGFQINGLRLAVQQHVEAEKVLLIKANARIEALQIAVAARQPELPEPAPILPAESGPEDLIGILPLPVKAKEGK